MTVAVPSIQLVTQPVTDPGHQRRQVELPAGLTLAELVGLAVPDLPEPGLARLRVSIVGPRGTWAIPREHWPRVRPAAGMTVVVRLVPGKGQMGSILSVVVTIAAVALGQLWALPLASALSISTGVASALITAGVGIGGNLLLQALFPSRKDASGAKSHYTVEGFRNSLNPDGDVPMVLGEHRFAPPFAMTPYTQVIGDDQYAYLLLIVGLGPHRILDIKIGDTPLAEFNDVEIEIREGYETDQPHYLINQQVVEERVGVTLTGPGKPETRATPRDITRIELDLHLPAGMVWRKTDGTERLWYFDVRVEQRLAGTDTWELVQQLTIWAKQTYPFFRTIAWDVPTRGQYEIRVARLTDESTMSIVTDKCVWYALRGFRPEYPLHFDEPVASIAMRIKVTNQLNGGIDNVNCVASRICPDWDHATESWITRPTRNPASLARFVRQGIGAAKPRSDEQLHLDQYADWHDFCRLKNLSYDRVHDTASPIREVEADVAAAGRGSVRDDGRALGIIVDRPQSVIVDHLSEVNSSAFRGEITYLRPPDGFRVKFPDRSRDYESAERIIPWPGHSGPVRLTEELQLPGIVDPDQVWVAARRRQYELTYRRERWTREQDGLLRQATRGDLVAMSHKLLDATSAAAFVASVAGMLIVLETDVELDPGVTYGIQFRTGQTEGALGEVVTREIAAPPGLARALRLVGPGPVPAARDHVAIGPLAQVTVEALVHAVENAGRMRTRLTLLPAAPIIDELTDLEVPPAWDGRVGTEVPGSVNPPPVPIIIAVSAGGDTTGTPGRIVVQLRAAESAIAVVRFEVRHRLDSEPDWTGPASGLAGAGTVVFGGYLAGDEVHLQARSISSAGTPSDWTAVVTVTVGDDEDTLAPPVSLTAEAVPGAIQLTATAGDDDLTYRMSFWQMPAGAPWAGTEAATLVGSRLCEASGTRSIRHETLYGAWDYRVTTEDFEGNSSAPFGPVTVTGGQAARGAGGSDLRGAGGSNIRGAG
ncbi:MAG: hypothetical protein ABS35_19525 [Kaistia sp. SCN 65-12]|nr:MAG: hypothetical protein ABS35_19525 [Kaistia sp. SCN 65-12]